MKSALVIKGTMAAADLRALFGSGLGVVMAIGFFVGIILIISGSWQIKQGNADQGKLSIIGGILIASSVSIMAFFYEAGELGGSTIDPSGL